MNWIGPCRVTAFVENEVGGVIGSEIKISESTINYIK